ncbi:ABC peptide/nickel transport system permease protein [Thermobifida fusca YX]|uniref:ABC peptide/nickel transport system permease protein n=1 Tax=Thermobifida fusca (strain YX) TaxID=269800 RepID=Q47RR2_THEFY|nr:MULTISPECIES: ABC transporter permease [Thermobifida]AAZ54855.1 ABC peptide/nickel transport system permease protein [Thermobifida fusca YX]
MSGSAVGRRVVVPLLRRVVRRAVLLFTAVSCVYLLAAATLHPRENFEAQRPPPPPAAVDAALDAANLNDRTPLFQRYAVWISGIAVGDFGRTWDGASVNEELSRRIGVSVRLLAAGAVLGCIGGVALGTWTGSRVRGSADRAVTALSLLVISVPVVVLAVALQHVGVWANQVAGMDLVRVTGEATPGFSGGVGEQALDRLRHLVLPTLAVALPQIALYSRYQRSLIADQVGAEYLRTARAKGMTRSQAVVRHALRVTLIPAAAYFSYSLAVLLTSTVFTEQVFGWHGVGEYLFEAVGQGDVNAVAAVCCFGAVCVTAAGVVSDLVRAVVDPRSQAG